MGEPTQPNSGALWRKLVLPAYLITMAVAVVITLLTIVFLVDTRSCRSVSRGLAGLAGAMAVVFVVSGVVVGVRAQKALPVFAERSVIVVGYGVLLLVSYVVITCGMMVLLNC